MTTKIEKLVTILVGVSVIFIVIDYVYELSSEKKLFLYTFDLGIVAILVWDFRRRMRASGERYREFILKHWYEIPAMVPVVVFALLETHTIAGAAIRGIRVIRLFRIIHLFSRTTTIFRESKIVYLIAFSSGSIIVGALAAYAVESPNPDSKITNLTDAFWWAIVTVTTVGYGDIYPVTTEGRIIASTLMIIGIGVLGIFISTFGAALIESRLRVRNDGEEDESPSVSGEASEHVKKMSSSSPEKSKSEGTEEVETNARTMRFTAEAKYLIKDSIDKIEEINEKEMKILIDMIDIIRASHNARNSDGNDDYTNTDLESSKR
jgi:voltage-gated potassium channel